MKIYQVSISLDVINQSGPGVLVPIIVILFQSVYNSEINLFTGKSLDFEFGCQVYKISTMILKNCTVYKNDTLGVDNRKIKNKLAASLCLAMLGSYHQKTHA